MVATEASAFQSLSVALQRKGIVADPAFGLAPPVQSLIDTLKTRCAQVLSPSTSVTQRPTSAASTRELYSNIQLWKERSLDQTLQAIDTVARGSSNTSALHESHIQAIEFHEQAAKDLFDLIINFLQRIAAVLDRQLDEFATQLAGVLNELIKPELEEQLAHERMIAERLVEQKLQLEQSKIELQTSHDSLSARLDAIENAPTGGGDALLCNKLRGRVQHLTKSEKELRERAENLTIERDKFKWETTKLQQKLQDIQASMNLTCAMQEKETKQLVALAHMNYEQVSCVMKATSTPLSPLDPLTMYDANSGRTVVYQSGSIASKTTTRPPGSPSRSRLVTIQAVASSPCSPNQKRRLQEPTAIIGGNSPTSCSTSPSMGVQATASVLPTSHVRGEVIRPFAPSSPRSESWSTSH